MPRLRQANAKLIFCVTLRETFNTPTLSSVKQKMQVGDAAVLRCACTPTLSCNSLPAHLVFCSFFRVGSLPSLASTDSAIPSCQCFLLQFPCTQADAFLAHPFTGWLSLRQFTAFDEVLQLSVHSISPSPSNPYSLPCSLLHI